MDKAKKISIIMIPIVIILGIIAVLHNTVGGYYLFLVVTIIACIIWVYQFIDYTLRKKYREYKIMKHKKK